MVVKNIDMLFVTGNEGKRREVESLINSGIGKIDKGDKIIKINLLSLKDMGFDEDIEETGDTCEENARIKAATLFEKLNLPCIADDSGLFVDYLGGEPGVNSARYAGIGNTPDACIDKLLRELDGVPPDKRTAYFKCVICCILPKDKENGKENIFYSDGLCSGIILNERVGENGFGYDPVFFYPPLMKSFAQLSVEEKNKISHRAIAVEQFAKNLVKYL